MLDMHSDAAADPAPQSPLPASPPLVLAPDSSVPAARRARAAWRQPAPWRMPGRNGGPPEGVRARAARALSVVFEASEDENKRVILELVAGGPPRTRVLDLGCFNGADRKS